MIGSPGSDPAGAGGSPPALVARGLTKTFPGGIVANDAVDLEVRVGEIHALLGENGAGKSTLSNMFTGLYRPDAGTMALHGETVSFGSPKEAIEAGIGMVHQHFRLVGSFTVTENLALGEPGAYRPAAVARRIRELGERHGLPVDPDARVDQLSVGEQQRVEILKALSRDADILILDEPTAVLTPQEAEQLFEALRAMAAEGRSIIFISHKLDEVRAVADRVTVLRHGRSEGTHDIEGTTSRELAQLMVGRDIVLGSEPVPRRRPDVEGTALEVAGLSSAADDVETVALDDIDLRVGRGEILAVCGVAGNGQRELAEVITGLRPRTAGTIRIDGTEIRGADPRRPRAAGLAHIPEDRLHTGLAPGMSVEENLGLTRFRFRPFSRGPLLVRRAFRERAVEKIAAHDIRTPSARTRTGHLSGGNIQKVLLARELADDPVAIIAASPTRGLDVGAMEVVRRTLADAADGGAGILLLSEDLDEVFGLADRIAVMYEGRIVGVFDRAEADATRLGLMMGGSTIDEVRVDADGGPR